MNITVIFTGGTIGSLEKQAWIGLDDCTQYKLLNPFQERYKDIAFSVKMPYAILSENLSGRELNCLQDVLAETIREKPDGIIVTHGTDTIQYTATAMEYAFADAGIPVVFVSAAYPLEHPATNGYINFEGAIEFIRHRSQGGVYVSYKNEHQSYTQIHIPSRLLQHGEQSADLYSLGNCVYATYNGEIFSRETVCPAHSDSGVVRYCDYPGILTVESVPGNAYLYSLESVCAIILKPYHSATLNTTNDAFVDFCRRANAKGIPIFLASIPGDVQYESSQMFIQLGIHIVPLPTFISLYVKIWRGISLDKNLTEYLKG